MKLLEGEDITPKSTREAISLVGKSVIYLRNIDVDKSGRGFFFPRAGAVGDAFSGHMSINGDVISLSDIKEMVISCDDQG